jgi:hypothetical protein
MIDKHKLQAGQKVRWRRTYCLFTPQRHKGKWSTKTGEVEHIDATVLRLRAGGRRVRIRTDEPRVRTVSPYSLY